MFTFTSKINVKIIYSSDVCTYTKENKVFIIIIRNRGRVSIPYFPQIPYPLNTLPPDTLTPSPPPQIPYPWIPYHPTSPKEPGPEIPYPLERTWYQGYPTPSFMDRITDTCENITFPCGGKASFTLVATVERQRQADVLLSPRPTAGQPSLKLMRVPVRNHSSENVYHPPLWFLGGGNALLAPSWNFVGEQWL